MGKNVPVETKVNFGEIEMRRQNKHVSYDGPKMGTPVATKGILINECFVGEEEQLAILIDRLKLLRDRVHSVLNVGQNGVDAETTREEFPVPMGERIISHIDDIKVCRDIVEDILDRLEI